MEKLIEVEGEGLELFLGERITLFCGNYIYTGKLIGVNDLFVKLENAAIISNNSNDFHYEWYVMLSFVESFEILK